MMTIADPYITSTPPLGATTCNDPPYSSQSLTFQQHYKFALARVRDDVVLVQVPETTPDEFSQALMTVDLKIFRHEFITLFRYTQCSSFHPSDVQILERIEDASTLYEEEKGTVWLAKDVIARLQRLSRKPLPLPKATTRARRLSRPNFMGH